MILWPDMSPQVCHRADTTGTPWAPMQLCVPLVVDPVSNFDMRLIHIEIKYPLSKRILHWVLQCGEVWPPWFPAAWLAELDRIPSPICWGAACPSVILSVFLGLNIIRCRRARSPKYQRTDEVCSRLLLDQFVGQRSLKRASTRCVFVFVVLFACLPGPHSPYPTPKLLPHSP